MLDVKPPNIQRINTTENANGRKYCMLILWFFFLTIMNHAQIKDIDFPWYFIKGYHVRQIKLPLSHKISHMTVGLLLSITWHDPNRNLCLYLNYQYKVYISSLSPLLLLSKWQYCYCSTWVRVSRICFALYCNYNFIEIDLDGMQCSTPINQKILSSKSAFWYIFIIICPSVNRHLSKKV